MSISEQIRKAALREDGAHLCSVCHHIANAFNGPGEAYWADLTVDRNQSRTFLLLVACALED